MPAWRARLGEDQSRLIAAWVLANSASETSAGTSRHGARGERWYRQPVLWLAAAILLASIAGCIGLIVLASRLSRRPGAAQRRETVLRVPSRGSRRTRHDAARATLLALRRTVATGCRDPGAGRGRSARDVLPGLPRRRRMDRTARPGGLLPAAHRAGSCSAILPGPSTAGDSAWSDEEDVAPRGPRSRRGPARGLLLIEGSTARRVSG